MHHRPSMSLTLFVRLMQNIKYKRRPNVFCWNEMSDPWVLWHLTTALIICNLSNHWSLDTGQLVHITELAYMSSMAQVMALNVLLTKWWERCILIMNVTCDMWRQRIGFSVILSDAIRNTCKRVRQCCSVIIIVIEAHTCLLYFTERKIHLSKRYGMYVIHSRS